AVGGALSGGCMLTVNHVSDAAVAQNIIATNSSVPIGFSALVVPMDASWRYDDTSIDRGDTWRQPGYNDNGWKTGRALFWGRVGLLPVLLEPPRTSLLFSNAANTADVVTYYFRTHFSAFASASAVLSFRTLLDDGAVVYLNGQEVQRIRMPAGVIGFGTLAATSVGEPAFESWSVSVSNLLD